MRDDRGNLIDKSRVGTPVDPYAAAVAAHERNKKEMRVDSTRQNVSTDESPTAGEIDLMREAARATGVDDPIRPKHYQGDLVARIIEHFKLGFHLGNVIKYILRHESKAGVQDLKKAQWYLQRAIDEREGKLTEGLR